MKSKTTRFAIVRETSAQSFEYALNERLITFKDLNPKVSFSETGEFLTAIIEYDYIEKAPEIPVTEKGVRFSCIDCPHFEGIRKKNGTIDERVKHGDCKFATMGRTYKAAAACEILYAEIENGEVKLCFSDLDF